MKVLVVGGGGREHALAWKLAQSPDVEMVYVAPGNAGTAIENKCINVAIAVEDFPELTALVRSKGIELTLVGPEVPLVAGIRDYFDAQGLPCFGPTREAAQLEGSKAFSKDFLARHSIPTGAYRTFTDAAAASDYVRQQGAPIVIKADGLAAGKGVVVARTLEEALTAIEDMLSANTFGAAGARVVVEEFLDGEEASFICLCDGTTALPFATSQDHKARDDGDKGPNTGGLGAYSPAPVVSAEIHERIMREVIEPTMTGMAEDGVPYTGFLYAGLMIMPDGAPKVIEFNCRMGDPEAQPLMMRLRSDLVMLCQRALAGELSNLQLDWDQRTALGVVMAAGGYPEAYEKGAVIAGLDAPALADIKVFHAGTRLDEQGQVLTNGGRVLCVVGLGDGVELAQQRAYAGVERISWLDVYYRSDIGHRAIARR